MTYDLDELERREREATPGPWRYYPDGPWVDNCAEDDGDEDDARIAFELSVDVGEGDPDIDFTIALRNAATAMFADIRRLRDHLHRAGHMAIAADHVLRAQTVDLCDALRELRERMDEYDNAIIADAMREKEPTDAD